MYTNEEEIWVETPTGVVATYATWYKACIAGKKEGVSYAKAARAMPYWRTPAPTLEPGQRPPLRIDCDPSSIPVHRPHTPMAVYHYMRTTGRIVATTSVPVGDKFFLYAKNPRNYARVCRIEAKLRRARVVSERTVPASSIREEVKVRRVPPKEARQVKKRASPSSFETKSQCTEQYATASLPPVRLQSLVVKLRIAITHLKARRLPGKYRMAYLLNTLVWAERYHEDALASVYKIGEGEGWFNMNIGLNSDSKKYLDDAIDKVTKSVQDVIGDQKSKVMSGLAGVGGILITAAAGGTRLSWITGVLTSFAVVGVCSFCDVGQIAGHLGAEGTKKPVSTGSHSAPANAGETPLEHIQDREFNENVASGLTLLFQTLGMYCGVAGDIKRTDKNFTDWATVCSKNLQFNARSTVGLFSFFKNFIGLIKSMLRNLYLRLNPDLKPIVNFWEISHVLRDLFSKANDLEAKAVDEFTDPNLLAELEALITIITEVIVRINALDTTSHGVALMNWCTNMRTKLLEKKQKCAQRGLSVICKPTPYVVYLYGPSGAGKSCVLNSIAPQIAPIVGVPEDKKHAVYSRCQGMKHFDGYADQQILLYDDFAQFTTQDPNNTDAAELFQLVTDQPFRPNMAAVDQKGKVADIKLVLIASNQAFPKVTFVNTNEALWRRRNVLIKAELRPKAKAPGPNDKFDPTYAHLKFSVHKDVAAENSLFTDEFSYEELIGYLAKDAKIFSNAEASKVQERLKTCTVKVAPRDAPITVEKLEAAVIQSLQDFNNKKPFSKVFNVSDCKRKLKLWVQNTFPFMYDSEKDTPSTDELEKEMEAALVLDHKKNTKITQENYFMYCTKDAWSKLNDEDKKLIEELATKSGAKFVSPDLVKTDEELDKAEGEAGEDIVVEPGVNQPVPPGAVQIHAEQNDPQMQEFIEYKQEALTKWKTAKYLLKWPLPQNVDMFTYVWFKTKRKCTDVTQLSYHLIRKHNITGQAIVHDVLIQALTAIEDNPCHHTQHPANGVIYPQPHCELRLKDSPDDETAEKKNEFIAFKYYKCEKNCVFSHTFAPSVLRCMELYDSSTHRALKCFGRQKSVHKNLDLKESQIIIPHEPVFAMIKKWLCSIRKKLPRYLSTGLKWLWNILKWFAIILVPIAALFAVLFTFKSWGNAKEDSDGTLKSRIICQKDHIKQQLYDVRQTYGKSIYQPYHGIPTEGEGAYTVAPRQPGGNSIVSSRLGEAEAADTALIDLFNKATSWLYVQGLRSLDDSNAAFLLRCFRIGGHYVLFPKHYLTFMRTLKTEGMVVTYRPDHNTAFEINFQSLKLINITESEMIIALIEKGPRARDLRKHFVSEDAWQHAPVPHHMVVLEQQNSTLRVHDITPKLIQNFSLTCFNDIMITLPEVLMYDWGGAGRCMSILVDDNSKIRGFHVAGNSRKGYAQIVTKDLLMQLGSITDPAVPKFVNPEGVPAIEIDTQVEHLGVVEGKYAVHQPSKTSIRRSDIHGVFPVRTVPAPLKPCDGNAHTDPLYEGVRKHGLPTLGFDREDLEVAEGRLRELVISRVHPIWTDVKVRSIDMALRGVEGIQSFKSMVLNTSEGFPYMCNRPPGKSSKRWLIHQHIENDKITFGLHDELIKNYNENMELRKQGIVPPTVFVDCLKDARLPIEKAFIPGKVRIFSVAPTDFFIAFRQYFADFVVSYTNARFDIHHAIGIAPEKDEWTDLVRHLSTVGNKFLCGDYKNFGPGFDHGVHKAVYRIILAWYDEYSTTADALQREEERAVRAIMQQELSEPIHIARNVLYRTFSGMCSGSPSTTIDNSLVNTLYIILAWFALFKLVKPSMATLDAMLRHLRFVTYGDDIIMCVSDEAIEIFNNVTLSKFFAQYGIVYTDALKTGDIRPYSTLAEATFLKRKFLPHPYHRGTFLGALEQISIEDCANWINKTIDTRSASLEASYACLQLAYGWGPEYYSWVRNKLTKAWLARKCVFIPRTWDDYERMYRECDPVRIVVYTGEANGPPTSTPGESTACDESKDTIIQDHAEPDTACPTLTKQHIIDWAGADYDASYERLINRYVLLDTMPWTTSDYADHTLKKKIDDKNDKESVWTLPSEVIQKNLNSPTMLPFLQHRYANVDMTVKVVANVNKFSVGRLIVSWYYLHDEDAGYKYRTMSRESCSQLLHAEIDAGSSNSVELCIPYKSYRPWTHLSKSDDLGVAANFGQLRITVVSQLNLPSATYKSCSVSVFVKFSNGNFMGVIPRDLNTVSSAEGQMLPMLTTMAAAYLMQRNSDANRDKPPVQLPPQHMQPMSTSSLAVGTGCSEPLHPLRLDARGQCPHPDFDATSMDLIEICKHKTILTNIFWKTSDGAGKQLWNIEVTPTLPLSSMASNSVRGDLKGYHVPPMCVIAGLMSEWRGSIEFEFDVIGSQYHTGRLAICFLPMITNSITLAQVQSLPYVVFDIHDDRKFTFTTPFIADKPWWPCGYQNGAKDIPSGIGTLFVHILNPLIPMDSIANQVDIIIRVGAAPSFELAIPRQSVWSLPWNIETSNPDDVRARDGYYPWFIGTWRYLVGGTAACVRYGDVSDHVAQFSGLKRAIGGAGGGWYYYVLDPQDYNYKKNRAIVCENNTLDKYAFIPVDVGDGWGMIYLGLILIPNLGIGAGKIFPENYKNKRETKPVNYNALTKLTKESDYLAGNPALIQKLFPNTASLSDLELVGESENEVCETTPTVKSTGCGMELFGESYNDGKDYMRRYEPLFRVPIFKSGTYFSGSYGISMDVLPAGYDVPINNPYARTARDGGQAIIASAFRFFRGSMNFKLIANTAHINLYIEHRPDRAYTSSMFRPAGQTTRDDKWAKNYAQTLTNGSVNKILTINVPFYQMGTLGLLQRPNSESNTYAKRAYSLGELMIGGEFDGSMPSPPDANKIFVDVYKSIGDDMRFYTYTGFPCLVYIEDLLKA